jgi:hypothetical protein
MLVLDASRRSSGRVCLWCGGDVPQASRVDAKFCGVVCRKRSWRFTGAVLMFGEAPASRDGSRRYAYADPPYPGKSDYYTDQPTYAGEVDHRELIDRLMGEYPDGWALSTSSEALARVLKLCPDVVRVASWHRRVRRVKAKRPLQAWEPLIVYGGRPYGTAVVHDVEDRLTYEGRYQSFPGALIGMKPPEFAVWLFRQLNACRGDRVDDLFPGSGAVGRAWSIYGCGERFTVPR